MPLGNSDFGSIRIHAHTSLPEKKPSLSHLSTKNSSIRQRWSAYHIQCSGKFLLVQNFAELSSRPSKETFVVLNFASVLKQDHTTINDLVLANVCKEVHMYVENFRSSYFRSNQTIGKNYEILHYVKISCYAIRRQNF